MSKRSVLWVGWGDLARRCKPALLKLEEGGTEIVAVDVVPPGQLRSECPFPLYNLTVSEEMREFTERARSEPFNQAYIANLPSQHLMTAWEVARITEGGITVAKPIDIDFRLVSNVRACPYNQADRIKVHDHYRNKGGVMLLQRLLPALINRFGQVTRLRFFLVEPGTIEEEKRLEALECGVILDLMTHLFAVLQFLFPIEERSVELDRPRYSRLQVNQVARGRYRHCQLENVNAETFAVADVTLFREFFNVSGRRVVRSIESLLVCGKGIRPDKDLEQPLKVLEITFEGQSVHVDLSLNAVSPLPRDLLASIELSAESGFHEPILAGLSGEVEKEEPFMVFPEAYQNASLMDQAVTLGNVELEYYDQKAVLWDIISQCCARGLLSHKWHPIAAGVAMPNL